MAYKSEFISTKGGYSVKNGSTITEVINQDGSINATLALDNDSVTSDKLAETIMKYAEITIPSADITATGAGKLGHAAGVPLVADPGANKVIDLVSAILIYDYKTAAYTDGGNVSININGSTALTGVATAANSIGGTGDKIVRFTPLSTAGVNLTANKGLNLVAASAFTQPGTAAGVIRVKVAYRVHTTGLA